MSSSRFPGKVLHKVQGKPMLQYTLERLARCRDGMLVVSTSDRSEDEAIVRFCESLEVPCHTGPLENVALRFARTVEYFGFDSFVRICGDSPFMDFRLVDRAMDMFGAGGVRMVTNVARRTFPKGQSVEMVDGAFFLNNVDRMTGAAEREHVTPYCYVHLAVSEIASFESGGEWGHVQQSVDTVEDMHGFEALVASMRRPHWEYDYTEILALQGYAVSA
jgi:spore coat polysaccharide biosynthesis protein SpsF